jgi:dGTPase
LELLIYTAAAMMDLNKMFTDKRTGSSPYFPSLDPRSEYQRDFDRIIFSSAFRRLQNKTQVFPLPGSVFVHNRLTHSLEVASVGRTLGNLIGKFIVNKYGQELEPDSIDFYQHSLYNVISAACLCHDIGNPAFGHSGEDAIANYFHKNEAYLKSFFTEKEWADFICFEGNANAIRILTQQQQGKSDGGIRLTYSTLVSVAKYPCESIARDKNQLHRKKFGFFQAEKQTFQDIAQTTGMIREGSEPLIYFRHPFVWLVEAADDICYHIIDLEDSQRLGIIDNKTCIALLHGLISDIGIDDIKRVNQNLNQITDKNDKIAYLRAKSINSLALKSKEIYEEKFEDILSGNLNVPMFESIKKSCGGLQEIIEFSVENIYNHRAVVEIENAGYNVMYELLSHFVPPILKKSEQRTEVEKKAIRLIPNQFLYEDEGSYLKVMGVLDYVSGMTDNYATELYRRIKGIEIGMKI